MDAFVNRHEDASMHCDAPSGGPESERLGGKRAVLAALIGALMLVGLSAGTVAADAVYHTERLALNPVGGAAGTGLVVNIHPNGPIVFASERYGLRGAEPNASYTVWLVIDAQALACDFDSLTIPMKADLRTNGAGNGTSPADFFFRPEGIPPCLRDASFPIHWQVTLDGTITHRTDVTTVTLD
jgi:hypothetical protein